MVLLAVALVAVGMIEKFRTLRAVGEERVVETLRLATSGVERQFEHASRSARLLAAAVAARDPKDPEAPKAILREMLHFEDRVSVAWITLEAPDGERTTWRGAGDAGAAGRAVVTVDRGVRATPQFEAGRRAASSGSSLRAVAIEPHETDASNGVEYVFPIVIDGVFRGVAGAGCAAHDVTAELESLAKTNSVRIYVVSPGERFVVAATGGATSTANLRGRPVADTPLAPAFAGVVDGAAPDQIAVATDPATNEATYFASQAIGGERGRVVVAKPVAEITAPIAASTARSALLAAVGLVVVTTLLVWPSLSVSRRLGDAVSVATAIADGNLAARASSTEGHDESAILLRSLDMMAEHLQKLVGAVNAASATVDRGVHELSRVTHGQRESVMPLNQTTTQVAAAAREISSTSEELAGTMQSLEESATSTAELAEHGKASLSSVDGSMRDLDVATVSVAEKLATINEKAVAINSVVATITKVADQTNILSVNAAIEAEKAGEQGRGFLVVAREIRRLADQTGGSTDEIRRMVEEMQSAVSAGVMEMDRFSEKVRRGVDEVARSSGRMSEIIGQVRENTERFRAVAAGMASQSSGASQISDATSQLREAVRSTVDGVSRIASTARALEDASESLRSSIAAFGLEGAACSLALKHVESPNQPVDGATVP